MIPTLTQNKIFSRIKKNTDEITNLCDLNRHRMTYERAGLYFRLMKYLSKHADAITPIETMISIENMGLHLPDSDNQTYAEFLDYNADRLQLFDTPKKLVLTRTSGNIHCSHFPDEIKINPDLDKWEYVEELS
jgi:hypothetical protein